MQEISQRKICNNPFGMVEQLKYFGTTMQIEVSFTKKLRADCSQGMLVIIQCRILLSSSLLSRNMTIKIYRTVILLVVLYGCETWSVTLKEEHSLRAFENRVLRRIFEPKRDEVRGECRRLYKEELYDLYSTRNIIQTIKSRRMRWAGLVAFMGNRRGASRVWWGDMRGRDHFEDLGVDGRIILKLMLKKLGAEAWAGLI